MTVYCKGVYGCVLELFGTGRKGVMWTTWAMHQELDGGLLGFKGAMGCGKSVVVRPGGTEKGPS
jgi:hypothetical protein